MICSYIRSTGIEEILKVLYLLLHFVCVFLGGILFIWGMNLVNGEYGDQTWKKHRSLLLSPTLVLKVKETLRNDLSLSIYINLHVVNKNTKIMIILIFHKHLKARLYGCDSYLIGFKFWGKVNRS